VVSAATRNWPEATAKRSNENIKSTGGKQKSCGSTIKRFGDLMQIVRDSQQLANFLNQKPNSIGCLADTGLLYAASYVDDRLYDKAIDVFETLANYNLPVYSNVISRMEFVDLIFRKQITIGSIQVLNEMKATTAHKNLFNLLKNIRDQDTAYRKNKQSYKLDEGRLKKLRLEMEIASGGGYWRDFCHVYAGDMLLNEWTMLEDELGLHFVEALEGGTSELIEFPLQWEDMVRIMGHQGIRGPDAMIINLFLKSRFPILITTDNDIVKSLDESGFDTSSKVIFILE
jgi:predicted nucleic acid-binding protein